MADQQTTVFSQNGESTPIPSSMLSEAVKHGAIPGVQVRTATGETTYIPANRIQEAAQHGAKPVPLDADNPNHSGLWSYLTDPKTWSSAASSLVGDIKSIPSAMAQPDPMSDPSVPADEKWKLAQKAQQDQLALNAKRAKEHGHIYDVAASAAEMMGVPMQAEEKSAEQGDVGGVVGHAATVPALMAAGETVRAAAPLVSDLAGKGAAAVKPALTGAGKLLTAAGDSINPDVLGLISPRAAHALRLARQAGKAATVLGDEGLDATAGNKPFAGEKEPAATPAQPTAAPIAATNPPPSPSTKPSLTAAGFQDATLAGRTSGTTDAPRFLQGESALRQILTGQDNANLMKIAKSRGINVTQESQLRPGIADGKLITKIIDDHSPEELDDLRDAYMQNQSKHQFGDIGAEAWKTLSMQTYFPDVKLPATVVQRTATAIENSRARAAAVTKAAPPSGDLTPLLQESLRRFQAAKAQ